MRNTARLTALAWLLACAVLALTATGVLVLGAAFLAIAGNSP